MTLLDKVNIAMTTLQDIKDELKPGHPVIDREELDRIHKAIEALNVKHNALAHEVHNPGYKPDIYDAVSEVRADADIEDALKGSPVMQGNSFDETPSLYAGVAKEWEVLEFRREADNDRYYLKKDGCYINSKLSETGRISLYSMLHVANSVDSGDFTIHSVRRLSDNTIWTVGDEVAGEKIAHFDLRNDVIHVKFESGLWTFLRDISIPKQPTFTTADGVQVKEGDTVWFAFYGYGPVECRAHNSLNWSKHFSSREAALTATRPLLSLSDLRDRIPAGELEYFVNLVKERSNG